MLTGKPGTLDHYLVTCLFFLSYSLIGIDGNELSIKPVVTITFISDRFFVQDKCFKRFPSCFNIVRAFVTNPVLFSLVLVLIYIHVYFFFFFYKELLVKINNKQIQLNWLWLIEAFGHPIPLAHPTSRVISISLGTAIAYLLHISCNFLRF